MSIAIAWFVTLIVRSRNKTPWTFYDVFVLFKGLTRWVYLGLSAYSVLFIIDSAQLSYNNNAAFQDSYK